MAFSTSSLLSTNFLGARNIPTPKTTKPSISLPLFFKTRFLNSQNDNNNNNSEPIKSAAVSALILSSMFTPAALAADNLPPPPPVLEAQPNQPNPANSTSPFSQNISLTAPKPQSQSSTDLPDGSQWRYSEFLNAVKKGKVERVRFSKDGSVLQLTAVDGRRANVIVPNDPDLIDILAMNGVDISVSEGEQGNGLFSFVGSLLLPFLAFAGLFLIFRRGQGGPGGPGGLGGPMDFGRSKSKFQEVPETGVTFADVAGADQAKLELQEVVDFLKNPDANVDGWQDLDWSSKVIHIAAKKQTKWWFAKRFLHPDIVYIYDYIFLWDEDLEVENFSPSRYVKIVREEGLEISQPALHPNSTEIHHRITVRARTKKVHRRVYERRGKTKCSDESDGPPCTGFVEGMAPVFSRSAWYCTWHLIQNDLVHGWGMDMKLGYCAQGDRSQNVGVVDSEYVFHKAIPTLGGSSHYIIKRRGSPPAVDPRTEIRRQSAWELKIFKERWNQAITEDKSWVKPFKSD